MPSSDPPGFDPVADRRRWRRRFGGLVAAILAVCAVQAYRETTALPLVRRATVALPGLRPGAAPVRLVLLADMHVSGPDMPPEKLARIVAMIGALHPDIVLIAGDFTSERWLKTRHYSPREAVAPLSRLHPRLGVVAVLGNNDHAGDHLLAHDVTPVRPELERFGITVLENSATRLGPLTIGGFDSVRTGKGPFERTVAAMRALGPPYVSLIHIPDFFRFLPPDVTLMLAGHTHCGQVQMPLLGPVLYGTSVKPRYTCGRADDPNGHTLIVTAGLGESILPFRFLAPRDIWLITLVAATRSTDASAHENGARTMARTPLFQRN